MTGTPFDFRGGKPVGEHLMDVVAGGKAGYDHSLALVGPGEAYDEGAERLAVDVVDPVSGRRMVVTTTQVRWWGRVVDGVVGGVVGKWCACDVWCVGCAWALCVVCGAWLVGWWWWVVSVRGFLCVRVVCVVCGVRLVGVGWCVCVGLVCV